jgi:heat shock protein HslJ
LYEKDIFVIRGEDFMPRSLGRNKGMKYKVGPSREQYVPLLAAGLLIVAAFLAGCASRQTGGVPVSAIKAFGATTTLSASSWRLSEYYDQGRGTLWQVPADVKAPELNFGDDGRVSGFTGVNRISAGYQADRGGGALSFSQSITTRMAALSGEAADMENAFISLLGQTRFYTGDGETLTLRDGERRELLVFIPAE